MSKFIRLLGLGLGFSSMFLCISCGSGQSSQSSSSSGARGAVYMLCFTSPTLQVVRFSGVFPIKTVTPERMLEEPCAVEFRRYVAQSGNEGAINVTGSQVTSKDAEKDKADELCKQGHQVIDTGWIYADG